MASFLAGATRLGHVISGLAVASLLCLAGCESDTKESLDKVDKEIAVGETRDPAVRRALEGQIMVDSGLSDQANDFSVRPPNQPNGDALPLPPQGAGPASKGLAPEHAQISQASFANCQRDVSYSARYAATMPADLPIFPAAQVVEAAGSDNAFCKLRAVTYNTRAPVSELVRYYKGLAQKAGYRIGEKASEREHLISGQRASDGGAFYVILQPAGSGTMADMVANKGR